MNLEFAREVGFARYALRRILWRIAPPRSMVLPTGGDFLTPREKPFASDVYVTECNVDWNSEYILAAFLKAEGKGRDFLDVGAHIGYYSVLLGPLVSRVFAFEPDERNHGYLRSAVERSGAVEIIPAAVADEAGNMVLRADSESSISHIDPLAETGTRVPVTTIDTFVEERGLSPAAVKIDIEGYDILALRGAARTVRAHSPVFLVEYNQESGRPNTWEGLQDFADSADCALFAVSRSPRGFTGYDYRFAEHTAVELSKLSTKMIFIVPRARRDWFVRFSKARGTWIDSALRPAAIREFLRSTP